MVVEDTFLGTHLEDNRARPVGVVDMMVGDMLKVVGMVKDKQLAEVEDMKLVDTRLNWVGMKCMAMVPGK